MQFCLNLNNPKILELINSIGYATASKIISYNGESILDIVEIDSFKKVKNEFREHYNKMFNITDVNEFNESVDNSVNISFWNMFTEEFYDWFGNWFIQYKLINGINLTDDELKTLSVKYNSSYDKLKDDISKVVTEEGLPKIVYHGSHHNYHTFNNNRYHHHFGTLKSAQDRLKIKPVPSTLGRTFFTDYVVETNIKPYFLNIKKIKKEIDGGSDTWVLSVNLSKHDGYYYQNILEDIGSMSYATNNKSNIKSAVLPDDVIKPLLIEHLASEKNISQEEALQVVNANLMKFNASEKIVYFQKLNDMTFGFITPDGKMFVDKSTKSLNTPFHEFYHVYDKILLSNYRSDERAKSIIDRLNELVREFGYLDKVKSLDKYKNLSLDKQMIEARAMLIGDAANSKIVEAEHNWLMKLKAVLKDLVDYILSIIGTKSFKDYTPEEILNMSMEEFTSTMTYDMMYDRSFEINKIIGNVPFSDLIIDTVKSKLKKLYPDITFDNSITTNPNDIITEDDEVKLENYMLNYLQEIEKMKNIDFKTYIKELKVSYKVINDKKYYIELISDNNLRLSYTHIGPFSESELNDFVNNDLKTYINKENISFNLDSYNSMKQDLADNEYYAKEYLSLLKERKNKNKTNRFQKYKDTETLPIYIQQLAKEILEIDFPDYSETLSKDFHALPLITNLTNKYAKTISEYYYEYKDVFTYFLAYAYPTAWGENGILYIEHEIAQVSFHIMDNDADTIAIIHGLNPYNKKWSEIEVQFIAEELIEKYIDKNNILPDRIDTEFEIEKQFINNSKLKRIKYPNIQFQDLTSIKPGVEELFDSNPELANAVYETAGLKTLENNKLEQDIKELIKGREDIPSSIFLSYLVDNNLIPKIQEYITSIGYRHGEWNELYKRLTLDYSPINTKSEKTKLISHELMHALSHKYITSYEALRQPDFKQYIDKINENEKIKGTNRTIELVNLTKEQLDALDNLVRIKEKVFDFIKAGKFNKNEKLTNANFGSLNYAFSELDKKEDIHEFISEAFSNPILIDVLKQIPTEGNKSNLFKEFIKALKIILGFNDESIIEDILYYSEKAFINEALKESNTKKQQAQQLYSQYLEQGGSKQDVQGFKDFVQGKQFQKLTAEEKAMTIEQVTKEHRSITALKDLAAKLAHRIGGKVKFDNRTDVDWKGYNQGMTSVLNEAYMTPDTPFHEILAHPIIRAIKKSKPQLYQSLLKELETGRGKEVFEQVKRDYNKKIDEIPDWFRHIDPEKNTWIEQIQGLSEYWHSEYNQRLTRGRQFDTNEQLEELLKQEQEKYNKYYIIEEQQEEAIVTLLGLMAADKLDAKKDATLISKLKELWKQISDFVRSLLRQDGIKIDELPITTTLNDLAEIMAYGNNKIILPGYKVEYSTPLGNKYDTLEEVNNEVRNLSDANVEVDLKGIKIKKIEDFTVKDLPKIFDIGYDGTGTVEFINNKWYAVSTFDGYFKKEITEKKALQLYNTYKRDYIQEFLQKNKEYEQSKEIIEQWKKENNIQYDPEEVYSRGQGFYSSIGAYSNLELDLLLKNLIQHIQDNKKAGGAFTISAFTKPIDKRLKHIEGTGDRVRFVIYPKSEHIKWAAPTDVYSGSVWDAHEKVSKDKKSELLGVSFTKAPALRNISEVSPNLADIIDNLSHVHNELGIELTTNNFELEADDSVPYETRKLIESVNKILQQKRLQEIDNFINTLEKECK